MNTDPLPFDLEGDADDEEDRQDFARIWPLLQPRDAERGQSYDVDEEWEALADRLDLDTEEASDAPDPASGRRAEDRSGRSAGASLGRRLQGWARGVTAVVLVLGVLGAGLWWGGSASVQTAAGERTVITLPDGSTAELNGATTLTYPRGFTSLPWIGTPARTVHLDGEAFFSVTDRDRPFHVETANARVEVLGTTFDVRARTDDGRPDTRVVVGEGRVRLSAATGRTRDAASVVLDDGGQASRVVGAEGTPAAPRRVDRKYVGAWRQGGFAMAGASVPSILRELERRYGTTIQLTVPAAETDTMTLHYARDAQLETVLHDLCLIQNLSYRETSQGYELVRENS